MPARTPVGRRSEKRSAVKSFHSWRAAVRIARRDAWRSKGRSVLVLLMIALPIVGVSAADLTIRSAELSAAQELDRDLGAADARYSEAGTGGIPVMQDPDGDGMYATDEKYDDDPRFSESKAVDVRAELPAGAKWITETETSGLARTDHGLLDTQIREVAAEHPIAAGTVTLLRGRLPAKDGEIAASEKFLKESGLHVGSRTTVRGVEASLKIVGAVELPSDLGSSWLIARPGALIEELNKATAVHGEQEWATSTAYLVAVEGKVTWDMVKQANDKGLLVKSRDVVLNPPPDDQVPFLQQPGYGNYSGGADTELLIVTGTVAGMAILEICLLAGPAFAVGARRSRRQLGLVGANGGDRRHVRAIVLSGGLVIGAAAAVLGVVLALGLTLALQPLLEGAVGKRFGGLDVRPLELTAIAMTGLVTGLLAAVVPAVVASRQSVLEALTGRRGVRRTSRVLPVVGLAAVLLGVSIAVLGSMAMDSALPVGAGSVIAELGIVALTPALVGLFGRLGRWLPLSPRLALRDAVRNRGRTAPAVAAVLAAVAGTVAIATYTVSSEQQSREQYEASLPAGRVSVSVDAEELPQLDRIRAAVEKHVPVEERADVRRLVPGKKDCGSSGTGDPDCGSATLVMPKGNECPLWQDDIEPTAEERRRYRDDWRCAEDERVGSIPMYTDGGFLVGGPNVLKALGIKDSKAEQALERGEAVAFDRSYVKDGKITLNIAATYDDRLEEQKGRLIPVGAYLSDAEAFGLYALLPEKALKSAEVQTAPYGSLYTTASTPTSADVQELNGAVSKLGVTAEPYFERGFQPEFGLVLLALAIFAGLVTIGAAGIATGLAQADSEADLNTLAAVGAAPRVRRTLSGLQCGVVAGMGVLLGSVAGLVPAVGLLKAEEAAALKDYAREQAAGFQPSPVNVPIVVPWETLLEILVVVPLGAALLAALLTRSRSALVRREG